MMRSDTFWAESSAIAEPDRRMMTRLMLFIVLFIIPFLLKRKIVVLLCRVCDFFACELLQCAYYAETCVSRLDYIIDISVACRIVRVAEQIVVFLFLGFCDLCLLCRVLHCLDLLCLNIPASQCGSVQLIALDFLRLAV